MAWYKVAAPVSASEPFLRKVYAAGKPICLVNFNGVVYALGAKCPHAGADLSQGWCHNGRLVCPFHRYAYSLGTGRGDPGQNDYVRTYTVKLEPDGVYVEVKSWLEAVKSIFNKQP